MNNVKLKMGMIGGGKDAFIGAVHRIAANIDGQIELVCGALSINPEVSLASGRELFLSEERIYGNYEEMIIQESKRPLAERLDFITIVTPNFAHFAPAMMALEYGFNVVIEKPIALSLSEALQLKEKVQETGLTLCLTHTYSGYPMVKQARNMVQNGEIGVIRKVIVQYPQGWLSTLTEKEGNSGAAWRTDPAKSGKSGSMGDIGTHAAHLAEYITGLEISDVCADLNIVVQGRGLDDDGNVLLKFNNGANGVLIATQIAAGEENALEIKIYGEKGGLEWHQMEPNSLILKRQNEPIQIYRTGEKYLSTAATYNTRVPAGHPEGYLEAFANIYKNFAATLNAKKRNEEPSEFMLDFPTVENGVRGMAFIDVVVQSANSDTKWTKFEY
jgi:predicted dehydrogenase